MWFMWQLEDICYIGIVVEGGILNGEDVLIFIILFIVFCFLLVLCFDDFDVMCVYFIGEGMG